MDKSQAHNIRVYMCTRVSADDVRGVRVLFVDEKSSKHNRRIRRENPWKRGKIEKKKH